MPQDAPRFHTALMETDVKRPLKAPRNLSRVERQAMGLRKTSPRALDRAATLGTLTSLLVACLLCVPRANAQQLGFFPDSDRVERVRSTAGVVDRLFREYCAREHIPGLSYGVMVDGTLIVTGSLGYANLELGIPADTKSLFRAASMSKSLTALAILKLRDEGRLRLDDPASDYIPELKGLTPLTTDAPPITIRHLMTHASGLPEDNP